MKSPAALYEPTKVERARFAFLWEHLRRNENYRRFYGDYAMRLEQRRAGRQSMPTGKWFDDAFVSKLRRLAQVGPPAAAMGKTATVSATLSEGVDRAVAPALMKRFGWLPVPVDPQDSIGEAIKQVLRAQPRYFRSIIWQRAQLKAMGTVAEWNEFAERGCAWNSRMCEQFNSLVADLDSSQEQQGSRVKQELSQLMKANPRMDFTVNTSLPLHTVIGQLKDVLQQIKRLRRLTGLPLNEKRGRIRDWKKHLKLYDVYRPLWEKRLVVREIGRGVLGFTDSLKLLGVTLTKEDLKFANELDKHNKKPKDFYQLFDEHKRKAFVGGGWDEGLEYLAHQRERRSERRTKIGFDDDMSVPFTAVVSKRVLRDLPKHHFGHVGEALDRWRGHFSVRNVRLKPPHEKVSRKNRNRWFHWARERVESSWCGPSSLRVGLVLKKKN